MGKKPDDCYILKEHEDDSGKIIAWDLVHIVYDPNCNAWNSYDWKYDEIIVVADIKDKLEAECYRCLAEYKAYFKDEFANEKQMHEKVNFTTKEDMAFKFCCDSLGAGWSLENARKLLRHDVMEAWIIGVARKKGICADFKTCTPRELKDALADAIEKCIACYGSSSQKAKVC